MTFYVSNLSTDTTREHLLEAFKKHGEVASVSIPAERMKDGKSSGPHRGYGFVVMNDNDQARAAMAALDQQALCGQALSVQVARPRWTPVYPS
ncbi:MAG TPA: RNA-binding protein [Planctomycetota bacterium]|nr:RNA-binding protein [Planctomycetota bacterium]